jgi:N-acetylglucosamine malate deacetylase 1
LGPGDNKKRQRLGCGCAGCEPEAVSAGVGEGNLLEWQDDPGLSGRLPGAPVVDLGMALNREDHLVRIVDQIGPERLGARLQRRPFDDEHNGHPVLNCGKVRSSKLIEDADYVELAVLPDAGFVTRKGQDQVHATRKMPEMVPKCQIKAANERLLVALSHPDDEVGCLGTIAAHRALGVQVTLLFLTHGEMTEALGLDSPGAVGAERMRHGAEVGRMLDCAVRWLDFPDTRVQVSPEAVHRVAAVIAEVKPNAVLTWGDAWVRGMRHPDHQATGQIVRSAVTLARIKRVVAPLEPHRDVAPVFTLRDHHSQLPCAAIDVTPHVGLIFEIGRFYESRVRWPPEAWLRRRLQVAGTRWGVEAAEEFDAWESAPGLRRSMIGDYLSP